MKASKIILTVFAVAIVALQAVCGICTFSRYRAVRDDASRLCTAIQTNKVTAITVDQTRTEPGPLGVSMRVWLQPDPKKGCEFTDVDLKASRVSNDTLYLAARPVPRQAE